MAAYPYDGDVRDLVARLLYEALPALYRLRDQPPEGRADLEALTRILAAPLAVVRQNIEELHADLFIDTSSDAAITLLAQMVGTTPIFPDADSNRRDVRGTVAWRRRKGTPAMLQEMGEELTDQVVSTQEGWKLVQIAQDLDLLRPERLVPDLRSPLIAETGAGPLDASAHAVDLRAITASSGRYHPRHVVHWVHPTRTWPLVGATAVELTEPGTDLRFAMHPIGGRQQLRARRVDDADALRTDRVPEQHFATKPQDWFGQKGRFSIRFCGLLAGVPALEDSGRTASERAASLALATEAVTMRLLAHESRRFRGPVVLRLGAVPDDGAAPAGSWGPDLTAGAFLERARLDLDARGVVAATSSAAPLTGAETAVLLRIEHPQGVGRRYFPGATLEIASAHAAARAESIDVELAREGFLSGALVVQVPPIYLDGAAELLIAADGSLYEARGDSGVIWQPLDGATRRLDGAALRQTGPGAAWPPALPVAEPSFVSRVPGAPGRGPALLHGGVGLRRIVGGFEALAAGAGCALELAVLVESASGASLAPMLRLSWSAPDPATATWVWLDATGQAVTGADPEELARNERSRQVAIAALSDGGGDELSLVVRFACTDDRGTLSPAELAWSAQDGDTIAAHLPQLDADTPPDPTWPTDAGFAAVSSFVRVALDGSTWWDPEDSARLSHGPYAPLREGGALLRRRVRWRRLCAWAHEHDTFVPIRLALTEPGRLDVDVANGLFALAASEPPQAWPAPAAGGAAPPSVTVDLEEGATMHLGALPAAREPVLDLRLPTPTRLVSRSGALSADAPPEWLTIPRYTSLTAALAAIDATWTALSASGLGSPAQVTEVVEVIQFEDSATYPSETPTWPSAPTDAAARAHTQLSLVIQAAEGARPVVLLDAPTIWGAPSADTTYARLALRGVALGGPGWAGAQLAPSEAVSLELCTLLYAENTLVFSDVPAGATVEVLRSVLGGLTLLGTGSLTVYDSLIDAAGTAVLADAGTVTLDRVTVAGDVEVRAIRASGCIFEDDVTVDDRFQGCVRYSRVTSTSVLPRVHRVTVDTPLRFVSTDRRDPAYRRLHERCDDAVARGAEDGSELGAFQEVRITQRYEAFLRRLTEYTPAGLITGIIRQD